jgi:hypothetical protein
MNADDPLKARHTKFAQTFPCLRNAPGVSPWEPHELNLWATRGVSHGEKVTARFVLAVWDRHTEWECGKPDLMEALGVWDLAHRQAFLAWAADPWWA